MIDVGKGLLERACRYGERLDRMAGQMTTEEMLATQDRGPTVLTVTIIMLCLSTAFVVLRLISRGGIVKRVSQDDYAIILAWVGGNDSTCASWRNGEILTLDSSLPLASRSPFATVRT